MINCNVCGHLNPDGRITCDPDLGGSDEDDEFF